MAGEIGKLISLVTFSYDPFLWAWRQKSTHSVPAVRSWFPTLSGPTALSGGGCGREGRKYKAPLSTRGKGKGMGRFPKLPSGILPGGKRALPPPGGPGLRYFVPSLLGMSDRSWRLPGLQSLHQPNGGEFSSICSVPAPVTDGGPRQGAPKARGPRSRRFPASPNPARGTAHASPTQPRTRRRAGSQTGRKSPATGCVNIPATKRKPRFTDLSSFPRSPS